MGKLWTDEETAPFLTPWREAVIVPDKGKEEGVIDGDSFRMAVDIGFEVTIRAYVRLLAEGAILTPNDKTDDGVNAWETNGPEKALGALAEARAEELLGVGKTLRIWSFKSGDKGKYGRWLFVVLYKVDGGWKSLGDTLVEEGHARYETY
ncbi:MAG: thermonuclease family protein [Nitrospira sp.]